MTNHTPPISNWLKRFLAPPTFGDEDKNRAAQLSTVLLQFLFVALLAGQLFSAVFDPVPSFDIPLIILSGTTIAGTYLLMRRGRLRAANIVTTLLLWGVFTVAAALYQGVLGYLPAGYVVCILFASSTLGVKGGVIVTALSIASTFGLLAVEKTGLLVPSIVTSSTLVDGVLYVFLFGMVAVVVTVVNQSLSAALKRARHNENEQEKANRELSTIRASLEQRINERTAQLNVSSEVSRSITSILDPNELIGQVVTLITERFNLYYAAIFLVDDDNQYAVLQDATGEAGRLLKERGHKLELTSQSMVGEAISTRRPRLAQDVDQEATRFANPLLTETKSEIALPLIVGDRAIGALDVQSERTGAFDEGTITVLQGLAAQVAIAINNAREYQLAQLDARQATALFEASQATGSLGEDLHLSINRLFGVVAQRSDFDTWMAADFNAQHNTYTILTAFDANEPAPLEDVGQAINIDRSSATPAALAIRARQPIVINAAETDPRLADLAPEMKMALGKVIGAPAMIGDQILGVITLGRTIDKPNVGSRDTQLAQAIASQLAVTIENHRLFEQAQASTQELNQMMHLYTHEGWSAYSQTKAQSPIHEYSRPDAVPFDPGVIDRVAPSSGIQAIDFDGQKVLAVPITLRGEVLGTIHVQDDKDRAWSDDELATMQAVADQVAQSMEAARLLEESETSLQETSTLYQASRTIAAAQTPNEILRAVSENVVTPNVDRVVLALIDPDSPADKSVIEVTAAWERGVAESPIVGQQWDASQIPLVARQFTEPLVIDDVAGSPDLDPISRHVFLNIIGAKAMAIVPMMATGRLLGWLLIEALHGPYHFNEQEVRRYRTLAGQATIALENRRLFQDVEARVNELTVLTRIGRRLASTLDLNEVLNLIVDESINATHATHASIALYNEQEHALEVKVMRGFTPEIEQQTLGMLIHAGQGMHGRLLLTSQAVLIDDVRTEPDYLRVNDDTRAEFVVPIRQGDLLLGALNLESPLPHAFHEADVRLIEGLADQVAVAITNARSYEAERTAFERMREADRLKTQFLANMSHELRTPLNSIIGFSRVILRGIDGPLTDLQQTDLTSIYNSGQHLLGLINNILDLSKIEAGKMELTIEPVDLRDIAKSIMSTAIALVKDKPIKLEQEIPDDLPMVMADQTRVRQIMLNLVSNATKFTEHGSVKLRIVAYPQEVQVAVTDTGIGVPADKLEHIFEEFTQVDASTTRRVGGTGLGLAITRQFVNMHHGRIWVESQLGVGSTFTFTLPREQPSEETPVSLPTDLEARGEGKKLILCIDDDPGVITLYKRYLEKQGYQVIGLTDPTKAVGEAKRVLPFAITLDVLMPNRDGWAILADLKKTPEINQTPIVVCSIIQDRTKGYALGATDYLVKPITEDELLHTLERVNKDHLIHKVLVVDDEPSALQLVERIVATQPQYQVLEADGGALALTMIQADRPDLILLDLMMPDIDGFAVLDSVKSSALTRHIPVIIITAKEITQEDRLRLEGKTVTVFNKGMFTSEQLLIDIGNALKAMNGVDVVSEK